MAHTPGPWIVEPHDPSARGHWFHDSDGEFVGLVVKRDEGGPEMEMANANLVAAAPDLLAALKTAQLWLDVDGRFDMQGINAAIAKAEGRT